MPPTSSRVDTLLFVHAVDTTHQWEKLTLVTWDNMDDFHFFEKRSQVQEYGLYYCNYVIFKNRPHWSMVIEIRIVVTFARDTDWERA